MQILKDEVGLMNEVLESARDLLVTISHEAVSLDPDSALGLLAAAVYRYDLNYGDDLDGDEVGDTDGPPGEVHPDPGADGLGSDDPETAPRGIAL